MKKKIVLRIKLKKNIKATNVTMYTSIIPYIKSALRLVRNDFNSITVPFYDRIPCPRMTTQHFNEKLINSMVALPENIRIG